MNFPQLVVDVASRSSSRLDDLLNTLMALVMAGRCPESADKMFVC